MLMAQIQEIEKIIADEIGLHFPDISAAKRTYLAHQIVRRVERDLKSEQSH